MHGLKEAKPPQHGRQAPRRAAAKQPVRSAAMDLAVPKAAEAEDTVGVVAKDVPTEVETAQAPGAEEEKTAEALVTQESPIVESAAMVSFEELPEESEGEVLDESSLSPAQLAELNRQKIR